MKNIIITSDTNRYVFGFNGERYSISDHDGRSTSMKVELVDALDRLYQTVNKAHTPGSFMEYANKHGSIEDINPKELSKMLCLEKPTMETDGTTTVQISTGIHKALTLEKIEGKYKSINDVIANLLQEKTNEQ